MPTNIYDTSCLDNCRISIVKGRACRCEEDTTGAIIELNGDIGPAMPYLSRTLNNCGYNATAKVLAFRVGKLGVVINADKITLIDVADIQTAYAFVDWLKDKIKTAGTV
jgi:ArsR family metal-binding transcriptional regulator